MSIAGASNVTQLGGVPHRHNPTESAPLTSHTCLSAGKASMTNIFMNLHDQTMNKFVRWFSTPKMNVQTFPRPPRLEKIDRHILVEYNGQEIASTDEAYWVLETHHPPSEVFNEVSLRAY